MFVRKGHEKLLCSTFSYMLTIDEREEKLRAFRFHYCIKRWSRKRFTHNYIEVFLFRISGKLSRSSLNW